MKRFLFPLLLLAAVTANAQQKMLTVEEAVLKQRSTLGPARLQMLSWIPGSHTFWYIAKKNGADCVVFTDAATLKRDTVLTLESYNTQVLPKITGGQEKAKALPVFTWISESMFRVTIKNVIYSFDLKTQSSDMVMKFPDGAENIEESPAKGKYAYTINNNVFVSTRESMMESDGMEKADGLENTNTELKNRKNKADMITNDGRYGLVNGQTVHRNEFGITKGMFWSPKGNRLAYYKMEEDMVTDYPVLDLHSKPASSKPLKYPMAGAQSHHVKLFFYDLVKKRQVPVETEGDPEQYLTNVAWSPDEERIYIAVVNRDQNEMRLNEYDGVTGRYIKTLFTEKHPKYVEPEKPLLWLKNNPSQFLWLSERDGFNHIYQYNSNGKLVKQLTKGNFAVTDILGFDESGNKLCYMAVSENGLDKYGYMLELKTGKSTPVNNAPGQHFVQMSDDGMYFLDSYSNLKTPRRISLMKNDGSEAALLLNAINPIAEYKACDISLVTVTAADGKTPLNGRLITPPQFDATKKYPVLVYLYGGPHAQMVTNSWLGGADMWLYYMAQQGFVVFTIDNRGSANRGFEFENATFRKLGTEERADQLKGVDYLKSLSYVDTTRMGVFGWSFGGFMSIGMMTRTNAFQVGVAGGPVIDWGLYEVMYTERYMDQPQTNPEGYKDSDLHNYVKNLNGHLLIIHGTDDDVVLWQQSLSYLKKSVDEGVQVDYFVYPEHKHNVIGKDRVHLMQKVADYFKLHLKN